MSGKNNLKRRIITGVVTGFALLQLTSCGGKIPNASDGTLIEGEVLQNDDKKMEGISVDTKNIIEKDRVRQQLYRDFATQYERIQHSLFTFQKDKEIKKLVERTYRAERAINSVRSLSEIEVAERKQLGIKDVSNPEVDERLVKELASLYAMRAKTPNTKNRNVGVVSALTLRKGEKLEDRDTTAFEEELRQYFTEQYPYLFEDGFNYFLSEITEVPNGIVSKYGALILMAKKYGIGDENFHCFGYSLTVQDGLIAEEAGYGEIEKIFYETSEGINNRIFDLYSIALFIDQGIKGTGFSSDKYVDLMCDYIDYAIDNGIPIIHSGVWKYYVKYKAKEFGKILKEKGIELKKLDEELEEAKLTEAEAEALCNAYEEALKNSYLIEFGDDKNDHRDK